MGQIIKVIDQDVGEEREKLEGIRRRYAARGIILNEEGKMAVFYKKVINEYKLPGGGMEEGESKQEAFQREVLEETGCEIEIIDYLGYTEEEKTHIGCHQISYVFVGKVLQDTKTLHLTEREEKEGGSVLWLMPEEALSCIRNCYQSIKEIEGNNRYRAKFVIKRDVAILEEYLKNRKQ